VSEDDLEEEAHENRARQSRGLTVCALRGAVGAIARIIDSKCDMHKLRSQICVDETCILSYQT
jgi:hypothetical protein